MNELIKQKLESVVQKLKTPSSILDLFFYCDLLKSKIQLENWQYIVVNPDINRYIINVVIYELLPDLIPHQYVIRFGSSTKIEKDCEDDCEDEDIAADRVVKHRVCRDGNSSIMRNELIQRKLADTGGAAGYFLTTYNIQKSDYNTDKWRAFIAGLSEWVSLGRPRVKRCDHRSSYQCLVRAGFYNNNNQNMGETK